ncbi:LuxR C-terminal-related transcriptional regulator [Rhodococcus sp. TAF43]|uniref:helix-turn-helix transcriptional regulator n=1 Tax=Rhodococcus sp. TAF43 TaxID=3237483 RepID=UPI003F9D9BE2
MVTEIVRASGHAAGSVPSPARLLSRLGRNCPLVVLRAPHGFGKSALVTGWLESGPSTGYLGVRIPPPNRPTDTDGYWELIAARLLSAGAVGPEHVRPGTEPWADTVRHALEDTSTPVRLALERVDLVDAPDLEQQILDLVEACHQVDVVVTMTGRPIFADSHLMDPAHDLLDGDSLSFARDDIRHLFSENGLDLHEEEIDLVRRLTGGLSSLMPIALRVTAELPALPHRLEILERYLAAAVTAQIRTTILADPRVAPRREFLLTTSTAHTLSSEVAAFLGGGPNSISHLETLESSGVLEHLGTTAKGDFWRLPSAVRAALIEARREAGIDPGADLTRLSQYHLDRNDKAAALRCAAEAEAWPAVVRLLTTRWYELLGSDLTAVREAIFKLPESVITAYPRLREGRELLAGLDGAVTGHVPEPEHQDKLDETSTIRTGSHRAIMLRLAGEYTRAAAVTRQVGEILDRALADQPDEQITYGLAFTRLQRGLTYQLDGNFGASIGELVRAHQLGRSRGIDFTARNSAYNIALSWALVGEPQRAREWLAHQRDGSTTDSMTERLVEVGGHAARALVALDTLDIDSARAALGRLQRLPPVTELWPFVVYARCRYAIASADPHIGLRALDQCSEPRSRARGSFVTALLDAIEIEVHLADGNAWRAIQLAESTPKNTPWSVAASARARFVTGDHDAAIVTCRRFNWFSGPYTRPHLEALVVEAAALYSTGNEKAAVQPWTQACAISERTGIRSTFLTVPRHVVTALHDLTGSSSHHVTEALASRSAEYYPAALSFPTLTERENEILAGLAEGLTSREIASKLVISPATVKSFRKSLYGKLGVHTRRDAVDTGRRLGIVASPADPPARAHFRSPRP